LPSWTVKLEPGLTYTLTDANGDYQFSSLNAGEYTVSEILKTYWQLTYPPSPGTHVVELGAGQDVTGKDFGNRESCIVQNLAVSVAGGIARARRQKTYATRYENVGTIDVAATVTQVLPPEGSYVSSRPAGVYDAETHSVVWDVGMLPASFTGSLSTIVEVALVPRGTALRCSVTIEPFNGDADTSDNRCPEVESVIGSCDPNMMTVRPAPFVSAGAVLDCNIYFQNVGNDTAFDIVVREVLDPNLDVTTVEPLAASHPYAFGVGAPNELVWFFNDIKLVDSITNEPASHGFLRFRIHSKSGLPVGTTIDNSAAIYFDFNEPVATNTVQLTVVEPGWSARESVPVLPSNQPVSEGGWLAYNSGDGAIYAAKGGKTPDFYRHEPSDGAWHALAVWPDGIEGNKPSYGSAGCADGSGRVYATKGNNTLGFWQYDAVADSWHQRADVPLGPNQQKVKGGTDIVWDGDALDGHAYLLKGQKNEFYRYDADRDYWEALADAPSGSNKKWDKGSWLASDGAGIIYAHRAGDNELYAYDTASGRWSAPLEGMPFVGRSGRKKASGDGGCGAYLAGAVYALKGGGTQECWKYTTATNSWSEEDSLPRGAAGTTVGPGADIVAADARLFATKGNKSSEFWQYVPYSFLFGEPPPGGVMAGPSVVSRASFTVSPNPVASGFVTLSFAGPLDHLTTRPLAVALFDVTGRVVLKSPIANRHSPLALDLRSMPAGVYVLTVRGARNTVYATKLVVQRSGRASRQQPGVGSQPGRAQARPGYKWSGGRVNKCRTSRT